MMKHLLLMAGVLSCLFAEAKPQEALSVTSPDGRIAVTVSLGERISYSVYLRGQLLTADSAIAMHLASGQTWGAEPKLRKKTLRTIDGMVDAPFWRNPRIRDLYNELDVSLRGNYGVRFRAYNNGVAYRFYSTLKDSVIIKGEDFSPHFSNDHKTYLSYSTNRQKPMAMAFQNYYTEAALSAGQEDRLAFLPFAVEAENGVKLVFTEADLEAYPGMFVRPNPATRSLKAEFAPYPAKMALYNWRLQDYVAEGADYIARAKGTRDYPWRVWAIAEEDAELPVNDLVYLLAADNRIGDTSWIKPGKVAWDWWNDWGLKGVSFQAGINTETYKYYIDFASKYNLEYIILDEGWYDPKVGDMLTIIPEIDLVELLDYAEKKNVGIVLWCVFNVLDIQLEDACKKYSEMGVRGFKVDFLDRNDQTAVERTYRLAEVAAKYRLFLDYHGYYCPTGMSRTYPNVLNFEGVFGLEEVKWEPKEKDIPRYDVTFPFIRMIGGPVDYTPGAMRNATKKDWQPMYYTPQSMGTRAHQAATYVVYDSPFTMLCDAPTEYEKEPDYTRYITSIPTVFDETRILKAVMGEYIVTARRSGSAWYIGALTNWDARDIEIPLTFLDDNLPYQAEILEDGINAEKRAEDYRIRTARTEANATLRLHLASGGGAVLKLTLL